MLNDPYFATVYNPKILTRLQKHYGQFHQCHLDLPISSAAMLDMTLKMRQKKRRGEVVMLIPNEQGYFWTHTKSFYPAGVYRLMTGGLEADEKPAEALRREVLEETGFKVKIERCLAVITYHLQAGEVNLPFVSYVFLTAPTTGLPHPTDPGEDIAHFQAIPETDLPQMAQQLRSISGPFADWGIFRAAAHQVAYEQLCKRD
ncbi:MAG: NUDIX hydrolase [Anaerolineae bacterium]